MGKSKKSRKKRKRSKGQESGSKSAEDRGVEDATATTTAESSSAKNNDPVDPITSKTTNNESSSPPTKKKRRRNKKSQLASRDCSDVTAPKPGKKRKRSGSGGDDGAAETPSDDGPTTTTMTLNEPTSAAPVFPYAVGEDDHCESPLEAYRDILPLLQYLQRRTSSRPPSSAADDSHTNGSTDSFCIYDPYYCNGAVLRNLAELGFSNVYNKKEDCYKVWSFAGTNKYPSFDVLVTNPPYSGEHIEKLIRHVTSSNKPWFLLLPNWVHKKDYYTAACARHDMRPFYLVPRKRYVYVPPKDFRASKKSDVHKKSSPFVSMWYVYGGTSQQNEQLIQHWLRQNSNSNSCDLARSKSALRDLRRKKR